MEFRNVTLRVERVDGPERYESLDGRVVGPLERVGMHDFGVTSGRPIVVGSATATTGSSSTQPARIKLSALPPSSTEISLILGVDEQAPAVHFRARVSLVDEVDVSLFLVGRLRQRYGFLATYLFARPPLARPPGTVMCCGARTVPLDPERLDEFVKQVFEDEFNAMARDERGPANPVMEINGPLEFAREASVAGGIVSLRDDFAAGRMTLQVDVRKLSSLERADLAAARELIRSAEALLPDSPDGRPPTLDPASLRVAYDALIAACEGFLTESRGRRWPPFRSAVTREIEVDRHFAGFDMKPGMVIEAISSYIRRPRARPLALCILSKWSGLEPDTLRRLFRQNPTDQNPV